MTPEVIARATWHQNSEATLILKCCVKDGSNVLATIRAINNGRWTWRVPGSYGVALSRHTAMRRVRKALQ